MTSILRNQNRRFKLLLVVGYFKLIANSILLTKNQKTHTKSKSPKLIQGPEEDLRREKLYFLGRNGSGGSQFPYNIPKSKDQNQVKPKKEWQPDDGSYSPTPQMVKEKKIEEEAFNETSAHQKEEASKKRIESIRQSKQTRALANEQNENEDISNIKPSSPYLSHKESIKRNLIYNEMDNGKKKKTENSTSPFQTLIDSSKHRKDSLQKLVQIYGLFRNRKIYHYLLKWVMGCRKTDIGIYMEEFENLNILLGERAFREKLFRTKIKLMQESLETQIRIFEETIQNQYNKIDE